MYVTGLQDVALKWCCSVLSDYPDFVPYGTYGSLSDQAIKDKWGNESCDTRVGGSLKKNCKGMRGITKETCRAANKVIIRNFL